jgi:hypothetical protein
VGELMELAYNVPTYLRLRRACLQALVLLPFRTADMRRSSRLDAVVWARMRVCVYWVGGRCTTSDVGAKLWQAVDQLRGHGDDGAVVLLATPLDADADASRSS